VQGQVRLAAIATGALLGVAAIAAVAQAATRIQFAAGSYCGSYSGDFRGGREFVLNLGGGQTFTSRNIGEGAQTDVYVRGPSGQVFGQQVSPVQVNYQIPTRGDYFVLVESTTPFSAVEFCAY